MFLTGTEWDRMQITYVVQAVQPMGSGGGQSAIQLRPVGGRSGFDSIRLPQNHALKAGDWVALNVRTIPAEPEKRLA